MADADQQFTDGDTTEEEFAKMECPPHGQLEDLLANLGFLTENDLKSRFTTMQRVKTSALLSSAIFGTFVEDPKLVDCDEFILTEKDTGGMTPQISKWGACYHKKTDTIFVVFCGSQDDSDMLVDVSVTPSIHQGLNGVQIHNGFHTCITNDTLQHASKLVDAANKYPTATIVFTGHSLGGALARVAHMEHLIKKKNGSSLLPVRDVLSFTFGAPMPFRFDKTVPGVDELCQTMMETSVNFINCNDLVPRLPKCFDYLEEHSKDCSAILVDKMDLCLPGFLKSWLRMGVDVALNKALAKFPNIKQLAARYEHGCALIHMKTMETQKVYSGMQVFQGDSNTEDCRCSVIVDHSMEEYLLAFDRCTDDFFRLAPMKYYEWRYYGYNRGHLRRVSHEEYEKYFEKYPVQNYDHDDQVKYNFELCGRWRVVHKQHRGPKNTYCSNDTHWYSYFQSAVIDARGEWMGEEAGAYATKTADNEERQPKKIILPLPWTDTGSQGAASTDGVQQS